ncbi:MAG: TetR/AcrR family transcriptional regulator [Fimbriiglobus sp.]
MQPRGDAFVRPVLETTLSQLAEVGFERLSIPRVAELAGVNKTSIYRRWPTKDELVREALQLVTSHTEQDIDTGTFRGDLLALVKTVAEFIQSPLGAAAVRILLTEGDSMNLRGMAELAYQSASHQAPLQIMARAMNRGEIKAGVAPELILFTLAGALIHRVLVERREVSDEFIEQSLDLVLYGSASSLKLSDQHESP